MMKLPVVDEGACCGHGDCAVVAPHLFRVEDVAIVLGPGDEDTVRAAALACPAAAIEVADVP